MWLTTTTTVTTSTPSQKPLLTYESSRGFSSSSVNGDLRVGNSVRRVGETHERDADDEKRQIRRQAEARQRHNMQQRRVQQKSRSFVGVIRGADAVCS